MAVLEQVRALDTRMAFPGLGNAQAVCPALRSLLERLGYPVATVRAACAGFRDWAVDRPQHAGVTVLLCLGHAVSPATPLVAALKTECFDACRRLMADWGAVVRGSLERREVNTLKLHETSMRKRS